MRARRTAGRGLRRERAVLMGDLLMFTLAYSAVGLGGARGVVAVGNRRGWFEGKPRPAGQCADCPAGSPSWVSAYCGPKGHRKSTGEGFYDRSAAITDAVGVFLFWPLVLLVALGWLAVFYKQVPGPAELQRRIEHLERENERMQRDHERQVASEDYRRRL